MTAAKLNHRRGNEGPAAARHRNEDEEGVKMRLGFNGNIRFDHVNHKCVDVCKYSCM